MAGVAVGAFISIASTAVSVNQQQRAQRSAAEQARRLGEMGAADIEATTAEEARRLKLQMESEESMALARAAASGVDVEQSSSNLFLDTMRGENVKELDWLQKSGKSRAAITRAGGMAEYSSGLASAKTTGYQGMASMATTAGGAIDKWYSNKQAKTSMATN